MPRPPELLEFSAATPLNDVPWPNSRIGDLVLDELFLIPPSSVMPQEARPVTIGDVAVRTRLDLAAVISRIKAVLRMSHDLEISPEDLQTLLNSSPVETPLLVDVREPWEYDIGHLPGSLLLASVDFKTILPALQKAKQVVTICHHGMRSYSAALYLRQHGVAHARSLSGGTDLWAQVVDPGMRRY